MRVLELNPGALCFTVEPSFQALDTLNGNVSRKRRLWGDLVNVVLSGCSEKGTDLWGGRN